MDENTIDQLARHLAERGDQPFGDVQSASGRLLQPFSRTGESAAKNLLAKAARDLESGDIDRATRYVQRAAQLPYDEHEEWQPAAAEAHMMLFKPVTAYLQRSPEGDTQWLDGLLQVLAAADEWAQGEIRDVLGSILQDYELTPPESARIRDVLREAPDHAGVIGRRLPTDQLAEGVMSLLRCVIEYRRTLTT